MKLTGPEWDSMSEKLKPPYVVYDVGAHDGGSSLFLAELVGAKNVVIIEPEPKNWPRIRKTWEQTYHNQLPRFAFQGFCSDKSTGKLPAKSEWPTNPEIQYQCVLPGGDGPFGSLLEPSQNSIPRVTLDEIFRCVGGVPLALLIDVEGSELRVIKGAEQLLGGDSSPLFLWISIHPELMKNYGDTKEGLHNFLQRLGYGRRESLGTTQEEHWLYTSSKNR